MTVDCIWVGPRINKLMRNALGTMVLSKKKKKVNRQYLLSNRECLRNLRKFSLKTSHHCLTKTMFLLMETIFIYSFKSFNIIFKFLLSEHEHCGQWVFVNKYDWLYLGKIQLLNKIPWLEVVSYNGIKDTRSCFTARKHILCIFYFYVIELWGPRKRILTKGHKVYPLNIQGVISKSWHGNLLRFESINSLFLSLDLVMTMIIKEIRNWNSKQKPHGHSVYK